MFDRQDLILFGVGCLMFLALILSDFVGQKK